MSNTLYLVLYVVLGLGVAFLLFRIGVAARAYFKLKNWNCHITETFRREHPELVVERPWRKAS